MRETERDGVMKRKRQREQARNNLVETFIESSVSLGSRKPGKPRGILPRIRPP